MNRLYVNWIPGVGFDAFAQPGYLIVDGAVGRCPVVPFQKVHDPVAREHLVAVLYEDFQQPDLSDAQVAWHPIDGPDFQLVEIGDPVAECVSVRGCRLYCLRFGGPSEDRI